MCESAGNVVFRLSRCLAAVGLIIRLRNHAALREFVEEEPPVGRDGASTTMFLQQVKEGALEFASGGFGSAESVGGEAHDRAPFSIAALALPSRRSNSSMSSCAMAMLMPQWRDRLSGVRATTNAANAIRSSVHFGAPLVTVFATRGSATAGLISGAVSGSVLVILTGSTNARRISGTNSSVVCPGPGLGPGSFSTLAAGA